MAEHEKKKKAINSEKTLPFVRSFHAVPFTNANEILPGFFAGDNDLAIENMKNDFDMTAADLQDFKKFNL